jgi:hypothetical protein
MYIDLHLKYPLFPSYLNETWIFLNDYIKKKKLKPIQWESSCAMWMDRQMEGQTDRHDEANSHFLPFDELA